MRVRSLMSSPVGVLLLAGLVPASAQAGTILFEVLTYCESFADPNCAPDFDLPYPVSGGGTEAYGGFGSTHAFAGFRLDETSLIERVVVVGSGVGGPMQFWAASSLPFHDEPDTASPLATIAAASSTVAFHGRGPAAGSRALYFSYDILLQTPFLALAGVDYYVSSPGLWEIGFRSSGPGEAYQCSLVAAPFPSCTQFAVRHVAFALEGRAVPEPGTLLLVGSAVLGMGRLRKRTARFHRGGRSCA